MSFKTMRRALALTLLSIFVPATMQAGLFSWNTLAQVCKPVKKYAAIIGVASAALFVRYAYIKWQQRYKISIDKYMQDIDDLHQDLGNAKYWYNQIFENKAQTLLKARIKELENLEKKYNTYFPASMPSILGAIKNTELIKNQAIQARWSETWRNHQSKRDTYAKKLNECFIYIGQIEQAIKELTCKPQKAKHTQKKREPRYTNVSDAVSAWLSKAFKANS